MCDEIAGHNPPAHRTGRDAQTFRDLGDREKLDLIVAVAATTNIGESSYFQIAVAGALTSRHSMGFLYSGTVLHPTLAAGGGFAFGLAARSSMASLHWLGGCGRGNGPRKRSRRSSAR